MVPWCGSLSSSVRQTVIYRWNSSTKSRFSVYVQGIQSVRVPSLRQMHFGLLYVWYRHPRKPVTAVWTINMSIEYILDITHQFVSHLYSVSIIQLARPSHSQRTKILPNTSKKMINKVTGRSCLFSLGWGRASGGTGKTAKICSISFSKKRLAFWKMDPRPDR